MGDRRDLRVKNGHRFLRENPSIGREITPYAREIPVKTVKICFSQFSTFQHTHLLPYRIYGSLREFSPISLIFTDFHERFLFHKELNYRFFHKISRFFTDFHRVR